MARLSAVSGTDSSFSAREPIAGPSYARSPPRSPLALDPRHSSPDYDDFVAATPARPPYNDDVALDEDDLLGSFEDTSAPRSIFGSAQSRGSPVTDLTGCDSWLEPSGGDHARPPDPSTLHGSHTEPIHVNLPPRPSEISPDYAPPNSTIRRMSRLYSFPGPGSPPLVSDAGRGIVFHPTVDPHGQHMATQLVHDRPALGARPISNGHYRETSETSESASPRGAAHTKLLNAFATTAKLANKWKAVLDTTSVMPEPVRFSGQQHQSDKEFNSLNGTSRPIDITHSTPFASAEKVAGSYVPPTGAPGYDPNIPQPRYFPDKTAGLDEDMSEIKLHGRRDGTVAVLSNSDAQKVRRHLPPRQRLSGSWHLLFSLDQHGVSLGTLYRLVDRYAASNRGSGNVLVTRDAEDKLFGVFMNEAIARREGSYYGGGESFLFKLSEDDSQARVFPWTGKNQYFALCEGDFISFGGGGGAYGLILDSTFTRNSSATSPAFDNEVLCISKPYFSDTAVPFDCVGLEVWGT